MNNAPTAETTLLGSLGDVNPDTWYEVNLTSLITADGTYSLRISDSVGGADYSSKEESNSPKLLVSLGGATPPSCAPAATATATPSQTPGATNTPTNTPTPGPSPTPSMTPTATATNPPPTQFNNATFVYDGDGRRVKSVFNGTTTTYFVGNHYEVTGSTITKYYYAGGQRIAMRTNGTLHYILGDHLGSTSLTTDANGENPTKIYYKAWGEVRYTSGTTPTKYTFTGQFSYVSDFGLMFYNARWLDVSLGRFAQADTIIPGAGNNQAWDRYAYANNQPLKYLDPSGHTVDCGPYDSSCTNPTPLSPEYVAKKYNVVFTGPNKQGSGNWIEEHKWAVVLAVIQVAYRFAEELGNGVTASEAFNRVYGLGNGRNFTFEWDESCAGCRETPNADPEFGYTNGSTYIEFASMSEFPNQSVRQLRWINNVIHELGHAFNSRMSRIPETTLQTLSPDLINRPEGFFILQNGGTTTYMQSDDPSASEIFADQFLGWVTGAWASDEFGRNRASFMTQWMNGPTGWVSQASQLP